MEDAQVARIQSEAKLRAHALRMEKFKEKEAARSERIEALTEALAIAEKAEGREPMEAVVADACPVVSGEAVEAVRGVLV